MRRSIAALLLLFAWSAHARVRSVRHPPPARILWIGAHPDDESLIAPILGRACVEGGDLCSLLVLTRGERGDCVLAGGCGPDLGSVRASEMQRAADLLHARLTLWSFSDVPTDVAETWSAEAGGHAELIGRIASLIAAEQPTAIYTFDPNHGSTCHTAHRALGALVLEAAAKSASPVMLVETVVDFLQNGFAFRGASDELIVDATTSWNYLVRDIEMHTSQFTPEQIEWLRRQPAEQRRVWLATVPAQKYSCGR